MKMNDEEIGLDEAFDLDNSLKSIAIINNLLHVIDDIMNAEDVCMGPWEEEIDQAKAFLAQYNVHEKYCFDCANICYGCNNKNMWMEMNDD